MTEIYVSTDVETDGPIPGPHSMLSFASAAFAMAVMGSEYRESTKRNMPKEWFDAAPHTDVALDDAIEQGKLFCNMLAAAHERRG